MINREKVIKGLEICSAGEWNSTGGRDHTNCPYYPAGYTGCTCKLLMRDALDLLREQEPRVMTLEEVKNNEVIFMEDYTNSKHGVEPIIRPAIIIEAKNGGLLILDSAYWYDGYVFNAEEDYGKTWRCWICRPTEDQRKAVKWND